jgi:hypothetical protein
MTVNLRNAGHIYNDVHTHILEQFLKQHTKCIRCGKMEINKVIVTHSECLCMVMASTIWNLIPIVKFESSGNII